MRENKDSTSEKAITKKMIADMLVGNFNKLPDIEQKVFSYGPLYLGVNAGIAGMTANSFYRRVLNVTQARFSSTLPMAVVPFVGAWALYNAFVSQALLSGDLNCPSCAMIRGALVGAVGGALYPAFLALPLNFALATRYNTALMPEMKSILRYSVDISKPVLKKMRAVVVLQAFFGAYLGSRNFKTYSMLKEITFSPGEELKD